MSSQFDRAWMERWRDIANADSTLGVIGKHFSARFLIEIGDQGYVVQMAGGRIAELAPVEELGFEAHWKFALRGPRDSWEKFVQEVPPPIYTDVVFMSFHGRVALEGDTLVFWQHVRALLWMLDLMREVERQPALAA